MNVASINLHTARKISAQRMCINGTWQLRIAVRLEDDAETVLTIFAETREALDLAWSDDEHCRITSDESVVEYSAAPFAPVPSSSTGAKS